MKPIQLIIIVAIFVAILTGCSNTEEAESILSQETYQVIVEDSEKQTTDIRHHDEKKSEESAQPVNASIDNNKTIVIDPGHASTRTTDYEPVGPGAEEMKMATVIGTRGVSTGIYEYALVMDIANKLRDELINRGYTVVLTKDSEDVVLSNIERAQIANEANADAFIRLHADASDNAADSGAMAMIISENNPYAAGLYQDSSVLAESVLSAYCSKTGFSNLGVEKTDNMTGNNWSQVPCVLLELGYMTNPNDDQMMATQDFRDAMAIGVADGIDRYFETISE